MRNAARNAVARVCIAPAILHVHPHDFGHRRISLWHQQGIPAKQLAERVGHSRASITLDVYSHVMPLDEVPERSGRRGGEQLRRPERADQTAVSDNV